MISAPLVAVGDLTVSYGTRRGTHRAVDGVSFAIHPGESYGLVGESGSGKSSVALALTRYLPRGAETAAARLTVAGSDVLALTPAQLRRYRGSAIGVVYQEPGLALNPTMTVGRQVAEVLRMRGDSAPAARDGAVEALRRVRLPHPELLAGRYPHELSGGQQQRAVIAMALAAQPRLLILDEPTTGLDSRVEAAIMSLIDELRAEQGFAMLLISHNLPLVAAHCERVGVMRAGRLVEEGSATDVLDDPRHTYTRALVDALPPLHAAAPSSARRPPLVTVTGLTKRYDRTTALDGVNLTIGRGEVLGIVGESGSGKTTLGRCLAGLTSYAGTVDIERERDAGPPVQVVFQNPDASLNPRRTVRRVLGRSIALLKGTQSVEELAASVGLDADVLDKRPGELSGGQKQRVAIARAFAGDVPLVVCDEPTSALDVSIQARILDLLRDLQRRTGVTLVFISHDLAVVRQISHRIGVMHEGRLVELDETDRVFEDPAHPYTRALVDAATSLHARR